MKAWHKVALVIIVVVGVLICVKSCVDRKTPDITLAYMGSDFIDRAAFDENVNVLKGFCKDIDGDGEINIDMMEISFNDSLGQADLQNARQKMANAVGAGVARVYFMEESLVANNANSGVFEDLSHLGEGFKNSEGKVVAISVKGNEKLDALGINTDDLYLAIRIVSEVDQVLDKDILLKHESAMNIAKYILN